MSSSSSISQVSPTKQAKLYTFSLGIVLNLIQFNSIQSMLSYRQFLGQTTVMAETILFE